MEKYNTLGERIKNARLKVGFTQRELASLLNYTQAALSQYEKGIREPGLDDLTRIADTLGTSTDYLLGRTEILSEDVSIKSIGDYLGLNEDSIKLLHTMYSKRKEAVSEEYILEELAQFSGLTPEDEDYRKDYSFIKKSGQLDLDDYRKVLNQLICSHEFAVLISRLHNNLYLERYIYDLMRVVGGNYNELESSFSCENIAEKAYALAEDGEDNVKKYSLNLFEIQNAIMNFSRNFTKLEEIKKHEESNFVYRDIVFSIYLATRPMFETRKYSVEEMENNLKFVRDRVGDKIKNLLRLT